MFRHYLVAALRNMLANKLQTAIAVFGLSIGIAAAILAGLVIVNQANFDRFLPAHDNLYIVTVEASLGGVPTQYLASTPHDLAAHLKQDFGEIEGVARMKSGTRSLRHGRIEAQEAVYDADPGIFRLLQLPVLYGSLDAALTRPDSIVIPQETARKYFGRDDVVGQTLELDRKHPLNIAAVIADLPANATNLQTGIFISGRAAYSDLWQADRKPANARNGNFALDVQTLLRLRPGASEEALQSRMLGMNDSLLPRPPAVTARTRLMRLDELHLSENFRPGAGARLAMVGLVAFLILFLASVNFINLSTARAARRGIEVGVRKAAGAKRPVVAAQFLSESILQSFFALFIAIAAVEWALPAVNAFLNAGAVFEYWRSPLLIAVLLLGAAAVGIFAGAYPALIISAFRPASVLKGAMTASPRAGLIRGLLVTSQFVIMVVLMIAAGVVLQQYRFAVRENFRLDSDQAMFVRLPETGVAAPLDRVSLCNGAFASAIANLRGVRGVACSDSGFIQQINSWLVKRPGGNDVALNMVGAGPGLLEMYGQRPLAGRALRSSDKLGDSPNAMMVRTMPVNVVINETAVRKFGFASPAAAIGHALSLEVVPFPVIIVGVVRDFSMSGPDQTIKPTAYDFFMQDFLIHLKLRGRDIPETLAAINAAWNRTEPQGPIQLTFMNDYVESLHIALLREGQAFLIFAGVAVMLGCLGLFGLSLSAAARRIKEIGIRKSMGATTPQIVGLLLWQFAKPILWANLIAWPLAWWAMTHWLNGFAYHVALSWWLFPAAGGATLLISLLTVVGQAWLVARQKPVLALRYE